MVIAWVVFASEREVVFVIVHLLQRGRYLITDKMEDSVDTRLVGSKRGGQGQNGITLYLCNDCW